MGGREEGRGKLSFLPGILGREEGADLSVLDVGGATSLMIIEASEHEEREKSELSFVWGLEGGRQP